ncbi:heavy-metal-associated domain-containing protein, partial [Salmonella enterica]|uniref:heavy-metal-associated domain-containing protein n=1 Tax=Salmonella enterica TaxID=28901 RepID=UPI00398C7162
MQFHIDDMTCGASASTVKKTMLTHDAHATVTTDTATRLFPFDTYTAARDTAAPRNTSGFPP